MVRQQTQQTAHELTAGREQMGEPVLSSAGGPQEQWVVFSGYLISSQTSSEVLGPSFAHSFG